MFRDWKIDAGRGAASRGFASTGRDSLLHPAVDATRSSQ